MISALIVIVYIEGLITRPFFALQEYEKKRIAEIEKDLKFAHPRWPGEAKYLREEIQGIVDLKPKYFSDMW